MQQILKFIIIQIALLQISQAIKTEESLTFKNTFDPNLKLAIFQSKYQHQIDLQSLISEEYILPRTLIDNLLLSNTKSFHILSGLGTFNHLLGNFGINFPENGLQIVIDDQEENVVYEAAIETLSDMFKFSAHDVKTTNYIHPKDQKMYYGSDPTEFVCGDNINKLKKYLPCSGNKGIFQILDDTTLFKSRYIGISLKGNEDIIDTEKYSKDYMREDYQSLFEVKNKDMPEKKSFFKLQMNRYLEGTSFSQEDKLVHKIKNISDESLQIHVYEYLQFYFYPTFHKIQIIDLSDNQNLLKKNENLLKVEHFQNESFLLSFQMNLKPQQEINIIIPVTKLLKSFENYPHNPGRGHDIIGLPVFYKNKDQTFSFEFAKNAINFIPEPDFSMPFNIITFTCVLMGYMFLQVYSFSTEKLSFESKNDNIFKKIINIFRSE